MISKSPYIFSRVYEADGYTDCVVAGLEMKAGKKQIDINGLFAEGSILKDYYSGKQGTVSDGKLTIDSPYEIVLLGM
jgi:alpha-amylase